MFVQTQKTPNPNSLKFLPGKKVSEVGPYEMLDKNKTNNFLLRNILSINGVIGIFLGEDFLSVNKESDVSWEDIKHIVISHINEYYADGNESVIKNEENIIDDIRSLSRSIRLRGNIEPIFIDDIDQIGRASCRERV